MTQQNVIDKTTKQMKRYGRCDFTTQDDFDSATEEIIEKEFNFDCQKIYTWNVGLETFEIDCDKPPKYIEEEPPESADGSEINFSTTYKYLYGEIEVTVDGLDAIFGDSNKDVQMDSDLNGYTFNVAPATGSTIFSRYKTSGLI